MVESQVVLTPRARKAERYATTLALIVTLGPLFYGFEGMVLNGAISAVGSEFQLGSFAKGVAGAAGIIGGLIGSRPSSARYAPIWADTRSCCSAASSVAWASALRRPSPRDTSPRSPRRASADA